MASKLSDPHWADMAELCFCCGYCLRGLPAPGRCPECGTHFEAKQLILWGVPNSRSSRSPVRMIAWGLTTVGCVLFLNFWPVFMLFSWIVGVGAFFVLAAALVALVATSKRERGGTERFVLSPAGIARLPATGERDVKLDSLFVPWNDAKFFEFKRVSRIWYRLRVGDSAQVGGRITSLVFDAGVRCPDEWAPFVREILHAYLNKGSIPMARPV